jgi:hypothetical protein
VLRRAGVERSGGVERCGGDVAHFGGGAAAQAALCARSLEADLHARQAGQLRGGGAQVARQKHLRARTRGGAVRKRSRTARPSARCNASACVVGSTCGAASVQAQRGCGESAARYALAGAPKSSR